MCDLDGERGGTEFGGDKLCPIDGGGTFKLESVPPFILVPFNRGTAPLILDDFNPKYNVD